MEQDKVILIKTYIDRKSGNMYDASPFPVLRSSLPEAIRYDPEYVKESKYNSIEIKENEINRIDLNGADKSIDISPKKEIILEEKELEPFVNINTADLNELMKLPGVGKTIAEKIILERKIKKLTKEDISSRIPLKFGNRWGDMKIIYE